MRSQRLRLPEAMNLLAGYLAATSRKLDAPLAVLIQSSSAADKSSLMDAVLTMMPLEECVQCKRFIAAVLLEAVNGGNLVPAKFFGGNHRPRQAPAIEQSPNIRLQRKEKDVT